MRIFLRCAGLALLLAPLAPVTRADATLRFHSDVQAAALLPAAELDKALGGNRDMIIEIKGNKAYSAQGGVTSILDLKTQDLIMVDAGNKRYATVPSDQYAQQLKGVIPTVPEQARAMLASLKTSLESRDTGRTAAIQGIQTEEHQFVLTMDLAVPGAGAPSGVPFIKMIMQVWTANPEELRRVPALQELKNYAASASFAMNPSVMLQQVAAAIPGLGDSLGKMMEEMSKAGSTALRTHMEIVTPFLALMSQQMPQPAGQAPPPQVDPNAPLMQMNQELVELSADPLDDSIFQVPADYQAVPLEEILKGVVSAPTPPRFKQ